MTGNKSNILYISHFPHMRMGGQRSMSALIDSLDRDRFNPYAVVPSDGELKTFLELHGCRVFVVPLTELKPKNIFKIISNIQKLVKIIKKYNIDIIHPDHERDAFVSSIAKKFTKSKLAWHVRLTRRNNLDNFIVKSADCLICISEGTKARFEGIPNEKAKVIFNGVDCEKFAPVPDKTSVRNELGLPLDKFSVLFAGQINPGKGVDDLLDAVQLISDKSFNFVFAGNFRDEDYEEHFHRKIKALGIGDFVTLPGHQDNIEKWMQAADVLILPSHEGVEGMGRVLFEAMACGAAVIGTDISGVREAVFPGSGLLIPQHNPKAIASAIIEFASDPIKLREYQDISRKIACNEFDIRHHARKIEKVYEEMLNLDGTK